MDSKLHFAKYNGLGNDFIAIDNRLGDYEFCLRSPDMRRALCCRRTGIGADGILQMETSDMEGSDVRMVYYNADGNESSFCGNGARCFVSFAHSKGVFNKDQLLHFEACDGFHTGRIGSKKNLVHLKMNGVSQIETYENGDYRIDTGSPHYVKFVKDVHGYDVLSNGRGIRLNPTFSAQPSGVNVNFVEQTGSGLFVRTYERGVEDETLACGTGLTAVAIVRHYRTHGMKTTGEGTFSTVVSCKGGEAEIGFTKLAGEEFTNITLSGPVCHVYDGVSSGGPNQLL